jgi:hypothetical protein
VEIQLSKQLHEVETVLLHLQFVTQSSEVQAKTTLGISVAGGRESQDMT